MRKHRVSLACFGMLLLCAAAAAHAGTSLKGDGVVAYYFHVNARCQTCLLIEQRSGEVIGEAFGKEIRDGALAWNVVNTQQPGNRRFAAELQLPSRGLVLVAYKDGSPGRSKVLDGVWQHIHGDPADFQQYVSREVRAFLKDTRATTGER